VAKLWLVSYSHQVFSFGSPYERAMRRQEAYNGVLAWNLNATINALPIVLIISLAMFAIFIRWVVNAFSPNFNLNSILARLCI
jgi:hypothetical protein